MELILASRRCLGSLFGFTTLQLLDVTLGKLRSHNLLPFQVIVFAKFCSMILFVAHLHSILFFSS